MKLPSPRLLPLRHFFSQCLSRSLIRRSMTGFHSGYRRPFLYPLEIPFTLISFWVGFPPHTASKGWKSHNFFLSANLVYTATVNRVENGRFPDCFVLFSALRFLITFESTVQGNCVWKPGAASHFSVNRRRLSECWERCGKKSFKRGVFCQKKHENSG